MRRSPAARSLLPALPCTLLALCLASLLLACGEDDGSDPVSADAGAGDLGRDAAPDASPPADLGSSQDTGSAPDLAAPDDLGGAADLGLADSGSGDAGSGGEDGGLACELPLPEGQTWEGHPADGWGWVKHGDLLPDAPTGAAGDGDIAPSLVSWGDELLLVFTRKRGLSHQLLVARSADGVTFSEPTPVVGLPDSDFDAYPSLLRTDDQLLMAYGSGGISLASSADGLQWAKLGSDLVPAGPEGAFDGLGRLYPAVLGAGGGALRLWYTGFDGQTYAIGYATAADGLHFERGADVSVLRAGGVDSYDNRAVGQPCVRAVGGRLLMWYGAYDTSNTDPGPWRVALARSADGFAWERIGVSVALAPQGHDAWSTRDPTVLRTASGWLMVYVGMGTDSRFRLQRATASVCGVE